jgi:1,4-alpha-glucan branching enzyme
VHGSVTRSPSIGTNATSSTASCGCTATSFGCGARKVLAYHRCDKGGPADDVVVVANFLNEPQEGYVIGFPAVGTWMLRFNSDRQGYSDDFAGHPSTNVVTKPGAHDGFPCHAALSIAPSSVLIFSQ